MRSLERLKLESGVRTWSEEVGEKQSDEVERKSIMRE